MLLPLLREPGLCLPLPYILPALPAPANLITAHVTIVDQLVLYVMLRCGAMSFESRDRVSVNLDIHAVRLERMLGVALVLLTALTGDTKSAAAGYPRPNLDINTQLRALTSVWSSPSTTHDYSAATSR